MKILALTRYERLGASSRVRLLQYLPYLREQGVTVSVAPLLSDRYLIHYYRTGRKNLAEVAASFLKRGVQLAGAGRYDLLWIEKELFPLLPAWGERLLGVLGIPYVVDYDDAVFHNYDRHRSGAVRFLMGKKIDVVMRGAALVVAGNAYLAQRARAAGVRRVACLPSVIDLSRYRLAPLRIKGPFTIGWIGSPSIAYYLETVREALTALVRQGARLVLVGAGQAPPGLPCEVRPWSEETEVAEIQRFDVGIMPLPDTPWERGKCGFKLIQYMGCGLPVVATPLGVNRSIVSHAESGFLAGGGEEWLRALKLLAADPPLRQSLGRTGRRKVEEEYSLEVTAPQLYRLLTSL